ncbi:hypothetical protein GCM10017673_05020 [Streptosporangium violaceochromogenes]|nr:hypothetical protein GCM10017673_05020 [Streptosporangium violaceochromogenes]
MTAPVDRAAYVRGLRALADLLERHPDLSLPYWGVVERPMPIYPRRYTGGEVAAQALTYVAAMDARPVARFKPCSVNCEPDYWLEITGTLGGLRIEVNSPAAKVCERGAAGWVIPPALRELLETTDGGEA